MAGCGICSMYVYLCICVCVCVSIWPLYGPCCGIESHLLCVCVCVCKYTCICIHASQRQPADYVKSPRDPCRGCFNPTLFDLYSRPSILAAPYEPCNGGQNMPTTRDAICPSSTTCRWPHIKGPSGNGRHQLVEEHPNTGRGA